MSRIYFNYGVMKSSKTANMLMVYHNYLEKGVKPILVKPEIDTRSGHDEIASRVGLSEKADFVWVKDKYDDDDFAFQIFNKADKESAPILIDEAQFFSPIFISALASYVYEQDIANVCVMAYGLLKTSENCLFEGSKTWIEVADSLREIKTICENKYCKRKATCNALMKNGVMVQKDVEVEIGDGQYHVYCPECYMELKAESEMSRLTNDLWGMVLK